VTRKKTQKKHIIQNSLKGRREGKRDGGKEEQIKSIK
jgi:hypothetical protein